MHPQLTVDHDSRAIGVGPALRHLTPEQVTALMARYYAGDTVATLLDEFEVSCRSSQLVGQFSAEVVERSCPYCSSGMLRIRTSRTSRVPRPAHCQSCCHRDETGCVCAGCSAIEASLRLARQQVICSTIEEFCSAANKQSRSIASVTDITGLAAMALLALLRTADTLGDGNISPVSNALVPFAPTDDLSSRLLTFLHEDGLISVDPASGADAFVMDSVTALDVMPTLAAWTLPDPAALDVIREVERLAIRGALPSEWASESKRVHILLAAAECRAYFDKCLNERGLPRCGSAKVESMIQNLLTDFSVSQAFRVLWGGAQQTADFLARRQVNRAHAANYAIGACQRWADCARAGRWEVKRFRRPYDLPRSMLSYVLHDVIMKVGDDGFDCSTSELWPNDCADAARPVE